MAAMKMKTVANIYTVLIILTDGDILDRQDVVDNIVESSSMPLSIVFVGLNTVYSNNDEAFSYLNYLDTAHELNEDTNRTDGDRKPTLLDSDEKAAIRDVATFVRHEWVRENPDGFAKAMFKEIGDHMGAYYSRYPLVPQPTVAQTFQGTLAQAPASGDATGKPTTAAAPAQTPTAQTGQPVTPVQPAQ